MKIFLLPLITLFAVTTAFADPYVGIGIGTASYDVDFNGGDFEEDGTGTKLYGGYSFNKYYAAEAAIYNFAEASVGSIETSFGTIGADVSMKGIGAYAVGMYPVSKEVNLMAKLGVLSWDADIQVNGKKGTNDGTDLAYALAASYAFTKAFLITAEWESFDSDNPELNMISLGFRLNFK